MDFAKKLGYTSTGFLQNIRKVYPWCSFNERNNNLLGKKFGRLTIIAYDGVKDRHRRWTGQCDCGNIVHNLSADHLKRGGVKSCGCLWKEKIQERIGKTKQGESLSGKTFGLLTVLPEFEYIDGIPKNKCICKCGNITYVSTRALNSGNTKSCGCVKSHGEYNTMKALNEMHISYIREYSFKDLVSKKRKKLRFDFYLPDLNILIECQGRQHYEYAGGFFTEEEFKNLLERDKQKERYCKDNNISLIKIPYTDYDIINQEYLTNLLQTYIDKRGEKNESTLFKSN